MRTIVHTLKAPKARGPYSQAVICDGLLFVAGQGPIDPATDDFVTGDIKSETRVVLTNIKSILEASGSSLNDVLRVGVFLADLNDFEQMNEVYREFFPKDQPARTTVGAQLPAIKVEIDCIARVSKR